MRVPLVAAGSVPRYRVRPLAVLVAPEHFFSNISRLPYALKNSLSAAGCSTGFDHKGRHPRGGQGTHGERVLSGSEIFLSIKFACNTDFGHKGRHPRGGQGTHGERVLTLVLLAVAGARAWLPECAGSWAKVAVYIAWMKVSLKLF